MERMAALQVLESLRKAQEDAKVKHREAVIDLEVAKFKHPGIKRNVKHNMSVLNMLDDMKDIFVGAGDEPAAREDNVVDINAAVVELHKQIEKTKTFVQHELNMQVAAGSSPLSWRVVEHLESDKRTPSACSLSGEELRKAEKERMSYDKDLKAARASRASVGGRYSRNRDYKDYKKREVERKDNSPRRRKTPFTKTGKGVGCFRCGDFAHRVVDCTKPFSHVV